MNRKYRLLFLFVISLIFTIENCTAALPQAPAHVVILVLENHGYNQIVGSASAPFLNGLINDPYSALFTQSFAISHPSQPNYLQLFSGSNQGVIDDNVPVTFPFTTANLGGELLAASKTFIGYSEDLPSVGYNGATSANYARKHNPWVNWQGGVTNGIPSISNQPFTSFPTDYNLLPNVSFVIPNQNNDMHNGTDPTRIATADTWVQTNLNAYIQWAKSHNSLLIITFDEDDNSSSQRILTMLIGNAVLHGSYNNTINHYNLLRLVEDLFSLSHAGSAATSATIDYCWNPCVSSLPTISNQGPLLICQGSTTLLSSSIANSYLWSTGASTRTISVTTAGTYSVTTTQLNGCSGVSAPVTTSVITGQSNSTVFNESMGTVAATTTIAVHETNNGFDNDGYTMSGSGDIRVTTPSSNYGTGNPTASGLGNVFISNTVGKNFIISGINTLGLSNLQLSFGVNKNSTTSTGADLLVQVSNNGAAYTSLTFTSLPTGAGTAIWYYRTTTGSIPATSNLSIQFIQNGTATQYRIDDVVLKSSFSPTITAGGPTTFCQGDSVTLTATAGSNYYWSTGATSQSIKAYTAGNYMVTVDCVPTTATTITTTVCSLTLNLKAYIQGFYSGSGTMQPVLNNTSLSTDPTACDSITVELHQAISPYSLVSSKKALLHTNGVAVVLFPIAVLNSSYYVVIKHRNSIEIWSKNPKLFDANTVSYDFSIPDPSIPNNPVPTLTTISPSSATAGASGFTMTLTGTNFISGSIVKWNGTTLTTTYTSSTQLNAVIPSSNLTTTGTASVTVFNQTPGGGTSSALTFTINVANNPIPSLTTISPSSATAGAIGFTMTLTGTNFISGSIVKWNGTSLTTTYASATQLTAVIPTANLTTTGTASVTVFNPTPGGGTSSALTFTINSAIKKFLFDATKAETAGNADWVIDEDASPQRIPTPAQSTITTSTAETFWTGALSNWGIDLVKSGNFVETLPSGTAITYGNSSNTQDLSNYNVFVVDEPNIVFTATEKIAILNFVNNGGGLFMISDHTVSDRNNDGWDSPDIWNDLMTNNTIQNNPFGFSIDLTNISQLSSNVRANSSANVILNGSQGLVSQLEFNNGATITINATANPTVQGLIWTTSSTQNSSNIMCASATFGTGRVFVVTDSSPMDDGTGITGNNLFVSWSLYSHKKLFMNASLWLAKLQ